MSGSTANQRRENLSADERLYFRDQLREARHQALRDAEQYQELLFAMERLGSTLVGSIRSLGKYKDALIKLAGESPLFAACGDCRSWHTPVDRLLEAVREARNEALHQGAVARHLTTNAIALSLVLEDALMMGSEVISDYMVRGVVTAYPWQPVSFVRQTMLTNSFSFLPIFIANEWRLVKDAELIEVLRTRDRKTVMATPIEALVEDRKVARDPATVLRPNTPVAEALEEVGRGVVLVADSPDSQHLLGILTAFDLL